MIQPWERDDLAAFVRRSERLIGDDIALYLLRASGLMEVVGVDTGRLALATGQEALGLAQRLGQIATAVEQARCED